MDAHSIWLRTETIVVDYATAQHSLTILITLITLAVVIVVSLQRTEPDISHIPVLGPEIGGKAARQAHYTKHSKEFLKRGYDEFKGRPFVVENAEGSRIILGPQYIEEIRLKSEDEISIAAPLREAFLPQYTKARVFDDLMIHSIQRDLTTKLASLAEAIADQADKAIADEVPSATDWTLVQVHSTLLRIVAKVSTRLFIGEEFCTNEMWLALITSFTINLFTGGRVLKQYKHWCRPFVYRFLPQIQKLHQAREDVIKLLTPIIRARREAMERDDYERPNDMLQWMMDERVRQGVHDHDFAYQAELQLTLSLVAMETTTATMTSMLYDLGEMPEYQRMIRKEVDEELAKSDGIWSGSMIKGLKKMDSFMKESFRQNPFALVSMSRRTVKPMTLSDGTYLPADVSIALNAHAINHDPSIVKTGSDPDVFDGLRYYKMSQQNVASKGTAGKHQFVAVSQSSLMFGYGRHACPGRFFASDQMKIILAKLLMMYDVKLEGTDKRYGNEHYESRNDISSSRNILIRRIER